MKPLGRYLRETLINLSRNALMSVASVTIIAASLVLLGGLYVFVSNLNALVAKETAKAEVTAFFQPGVSRETVDKRIREISKYPGVAEVTFVSKEELMRRLFPPDNPHAALVQKEMKFPDGVEVRLERPEEGKAIAARIAKIAEVRRVNYGAAVVERLLAVKRAINLGGTVAVLIFALAALLTVSSTIHLTISAREQEIGIMQLVGATAWYIKGPFLLEGMIHGLLGSLVALLVLATGYGRAYAYVEQRLPFIQAVDPGSVTPALLALLLGAGVAFGLLGSYLSVRRLLHVG